MTELLKATSYTEAARHYDALWASCLSQALVTVVIPFFNEVGKTCRALESVLNQTHRHLDVVLVDDGSTEDTSELARFAASDQRVRLVRQSNVGPGSARNLRMRLAGGSYTAFLDADA